MLPPLIIIAIEGLPHVSINSAILFAAFSSLGIGFGAALLALVLAWPLGKMPQLAAQNLALAGLIVPPAVMATGWFLALKKFDTGIAVTLLSVIILNAMMALPFSVAILRARFVNSGAPYEKLCRQLGLAGWRRLWRIDLPFMAPALRQAGLISFVVSLGDLTAVTLLGSNGLTTLPQLIHQQMGNYRSNAAAGTALVLALCCLGLAMLAQRSGKAQ